VRGAVIRIYSCQGESVGECLVLGQRAGIPDAVIAGGGVYYTIPVSSLAGIKLKSSISTSWRIAFAGDGKAIKALTTTTVAIINLNISFILCSLI
jgi:hypothetical protein